jgi:hypothetical protein
MGCLLDALGCGYRVLGFDAAAGGDSVFRDLMLARIIEPVKASSTACGFSRRPGSRRPPTGLSGGAFRPMRGSNGGSGCRRPAPRTPGSARPAWSFTTRPVIGSCHELWRIEKSFRMSKSDLQARPIYHRKRDSIEAHLTIVFATLAVGRWIEAQTGWSIRKLVKTARRDREIEIEIKAGQHVITPADPLPDDLRQALDAINHAN